MITIVHGGQTGVDRGAHDGAVENKWNITGYMPNDGKCEDGGIPHYVEVFLKRCHHRGYAARTTANLEIAHALLVVTRDVQHPYATPGTKLTLDEARRLAVPRMVVEPSTHLPTIATWLGKLIKTANPDVPFHLMVAGPRASRWADGRVETRRMLMEIAQHLATT